MLHFAVIFPHYFSASLPSPEMRCTSPAPVHQVMGLVNEKDILSLHSFRKETLQIYMGIENIIIITDDPSEKDSYPGSYF